MSDENPETRKGQIRVIREGKTGTIFRVELVFPTCSIAVRWDDSEKDGRNAAMWLANELGTDLPSAFREIDIQRETESLEADLNALFEDTE